MRVIKDNGHRYITDEGNTFVAIMGKDNRMLVRFDYDPEAQNSVLGTMSLIPTVLGPFFFGIRDIVLDI